MTNANTVILNDKPTATKVAEAPKLTQARIACANAAKKDAMALKDYAKALLNSATIGADILLPKGQETPAVKVEREAYYGLLKARGISNPSVYWGRVKTTCAPVSATDANHIEKKAGDPWTKETVDLIVRRFARDDTNSKLLERLDKAIREEFKNEQWAKAMFAAADVLATK
jgi:hypothetical protein